MTPHGWLDELAAGMAVAFAAVCSIAFVGFYTTGALQALATPADAGPPGGNAAVDTDVVTVQVFWILVATAVVVSLLATGAVPASSLGLSRSDRRLSRQGKLAVLMLGALTCVIGWLPQLLVTTAGFSDPNDALFDRTPPLAAVVSSFSAGVAEEVLVLAAPLVLLERFGLTRWRIGRLPAGWLLVGVVLVGVRLAFHLYRGWATVQFLPWAIAAVLAFYWTRALIAMIAAHIVWDLMALLLPGTAMYSTSAAAWHITLGSLAVVGVASGWILVRRGELVGNHLA